MLKCRPSIFALVAGLAVGGTVSPALAQHRTPVEFNDSCVPIGVLKNGVRPWPHSTVCQIVDSVDPLPPGSWRREPTATARSYRDRSTMKPAPSDLSSWWKRLVGLLSFH